MNEFLAAAYAHEVATDPNEVTSSGNWLDTAANLPVFATQIGVSAITEVLNIPTAIASIPINFLGGEMDGKWLRTEEVFSGLDDTLGTDMESYYRKRKEAVDMGGFIVGSFAPGLLGAKVLRTGLGTAAKATETSGMVRAVGNFERMPSRILDAAKLEVATTSSPFTYMNSKAISLYAAGAGQGVLDALAFNTAATIALHQSSYLEKKDWGELTKDVLFDSVIFGAAFGTVFDIGGKGAGIFGYKKVMGEYSDKFANIKATALNPFMREGDQVVAGARFAKADGSVVKVTPGDAALQRLNDVKEFEQRATELKGMIESGQLSAGNKELLEAEIRSFTRDRASALKAAQMEFQKHAKDLFSDVEHIVDVNGIMKQMLRPESTLDEAASLMAQLKKVSTLTADDLSDATLSNSLKVFKAEGKGVTDFTFTGAEGAASKLVKIRNPLRAADELDLAAQLGMQPGKKLSVLQIDDLATAKGFDSIIVGDSVRLIPKFNKHGKVITPRSPKSALIDIRTGAIVNKAHNATAWDLGKREFDDIVASMKPEGDDILELSSNLSPIENSSIYRKAMDEYQRKRLTQASSIAELDILVARGYDKNKGLVYDGKVISEERAKELIADHKTKVATEMGEQGYSTEQISSSLMMPEETLFSPNSIKGFTTVGDDSLQAPRYVKADYAASRDLNKFELEGKLEVEMKIRQAKLQLDATVSAISPEIGAAIPISMPRYSENSTSGAFSYMDAKWGSIFEQGVQRANRFYGKVMQAAAAKRVDPLRSQVQKIQSFGVGSPEHTEFVVLNSWIKQAKNSANGLHPVAIETGTGSHTFMDGATFATTKSRMVDDLKKLAETNPEEAAMRMESMTGRDVLDEYLTGNMDVLSKGPGTPGSLMNVKSQAVSDFVTGHINANQATVRSKNMMKNLHGERNISVETLPGAKTYYDPGVDLRSAQHVLIIKGAADHGNPMFAGQQYAFAGKSADSLREARAVADELGLQTFTKGEVSDFYKHLDAYDASQTFNKGTIKSELESRGKLTSFTGAAESFEDTAARYMDWHLRDEFALQRSVIAAKEYEVLGALKHIDLVDKRLLESTKGNQTKFSKLLAGEASRLTKPEQIRNAIFNTQNPGVVGAIVKTVDDFAVGFTTKVHNIFKDIKAHEIDNPNSPMTKKLMAQLDEMNVEQYVTKDIMAAVGVTNFDSPMYSSFVRASNMALVMGQLRLDALNTLVNMLSMPIIGSSTVELAIRANMKRLKESGRLDQAEKLQQALYQKEGQLGFMPSTYVRMAKQSINRMGTKAKDNPILGPTAQGDETLAEYYLRNKITFNPVEVAAMDLENAAVEGIKAGNTQASFYVDKMKKFLSVLAKPSDAIESRMQFISADAGLQIAEAGAMTLDEASLLMHTMVSKLQGNYTASAKPQLFQGITGSALGLFQSYQARLIHRLSDVILDGNKRMLAEATVLQTSVFGGRSLPFFEQFNSSLIGQSNQDNADLYSGIYGSADRNLANSMVYGLPSALLGINMSTRGNATPRLPNGVTDIPAISIWYKQLSQIKDLATQAADGGDITQLFNHGLQHNVFSRPLQQLAVVSAGYSTTQNNKLGISLNDAKLVNENNWLPVNVTNFMRLAGSKPLDEAVLMDQVFRWQGYETSDRAKREELGRAVSSQLLGNGNQLDSKSVENFLTEYQKQGGDTKGYERWVKGQLTNTTLSSSDRLLKKINNEPKLLQLGYLLGRKPDPSLIPSYDEIVPRDPTIGQE